MRKTYFARFNPNPAARKRNGGRGVVRVTYDTLGRPAGPFDRSILLQLNGDRIRLRLRGNAIDTSVTTQPFYSPSF